MSIPPSLDRLSPLLERFPVRARFFHSGLLCATQHFDAVPGVGHLHVLRAGRVEVRHPGRRLPGTLELERPTLLLYPRPLAHRFQYAEEGGFFTCAELRFEGAALHPLAQALPDVVVVPLAEVEGLSTVLELLFAEVDRRRCGQQLLADRLFDVVMIQLLRWMLDHPARAGLPPGLMAGLADPRLARLLLALHRLPGESWSLLTMAATAGMSRTVFAKQFREQIGQTPADYLLALRVVLAQVGLRHGHSLKRLADTLGYANASALSRAFTQRMGCSPREWLRRPD